MAALGLDEGDVLAYFREVGESEVAHLVVGAAAAVEFERLGCPPVGEAGAAGLGAQVNCGGPTRWCRGDNGQKKRAPTASFDEPGKQPRRNGCPEDPLGVATLSDDDSLLVRQLRSSTFKFRS